MVVEAYCCVNVAVKQALWHIFCLSYRKQAALLFTEGHEAAVDTVQSVLKVGLVRTSYCKQTCQLVFVVSKAEEAVLSVLIACKFGVRGFCQCRHREKKWFD